MNTEEKPSKEILERRHNDPNNWLWGLFYYNNKDKRIFPPKKIKFLGWTVNFSNPISVITLISIIVLIAIISSNLSKS